MELCEYVMLYQEGAASGDIGIVLSCTPGTHSGDQDRHSRGVGGQWRCSALQQRGCLHVVVVKVREAGVPWQLTALAGTHHIAKASCSGDMQGCCIAELREADINVQTQSNECLDALLYAFQTACLHPQVTAW